MKITCISDLHGHYPETIGGDLLILAGDYTRSNKISEWVEFFNWLKAQNYRKKVYIGGNHDGFLESCLSSNEAKDLQVWEEEGHEYLWDSGTEFEGSKIWGSPWVKSFNGMNPKCKAFTLDTEEELAKKWTLIPDDTDILITHSPPFSIRDLTYTGDQVGSTTLMDRITLGLRPRLWVMGHIHESYGKEGPFKWAKTRFVNASHVNVFCKPVKPPINIELYL